MYADIGIMLILIGVAFAGSDCLTAHDVTAFENRQPGLAARGESRQFGFVTRSNLLSSWSLIECN